MWRMTVRNDARADFARNSLRGHPDRDFVVEAVYRLQLLERHGPDEDQRCELLDGRYETYAIRPIARLDHHLMLVHDRLGRELVFLGVVRNVVDPCAATSREACAALGLATPTRTP